MKETVMPNRNTGLRHAAVRDCIRGALERLGPAVGARTGACRADLEMGPPAPGGPGPPAPPVKPPGTATKPRPSKTSNPRRRFSPDDAIPFPEGWERRGG